MPARAATVRAAGTRTVSPATVSTRTAATTASTATDPSATGSPAHLGEQPDRRRAAEQAGVPDGGGQRDARGAAEEARPRDRQREDVRQAQPDDDEAGERDRTAWRWSPRRAPRRRPRARRRPGAVARPTPGGAGSRPTGRTPWPARTRRNRPRPACSAPTSPRAAGGRPSRSARPRRRRCSRRRRPGRRARPSGRGCPSVASAAVLAGTRRSVAVSTGSAQAVTNRPAAATRARCAGTPRTAAAAPPTSAPPRPPKLNPACSPDSSGRPARASTWTPTAFAETLIIPVAAPKTNSTAHSAGTVETRPGSDGGQRDEHRGDGATGPAPNRAHSEPVTRMQTSAPSDRHSSATPRAVWPAPTVAATSGTRDGPAAEDGAVEHEEGGDGGAEPRRRRRGAVGSRRDRSGRRGTGIRARRDSERADTGEPLGGTTATRGFGAATRGRGKSTRPRAPAFHGASRTCPARVQHVPIAA